MDLWLVSAAERAAASVGCQAIGIATILIEVEPDRSNGYFPIQKLANTRSSTASTSTDPISSSRCEAASLT